MSKRDEERKARREEYLKFEELKRKARFEELKPRVGGDFRVMDAEGETRSVDPNLIREVVFARNYEFEMYMRNGRIPTLYQVPIRALDSGRLIPPKGVIEVMVVVEDEKKKHPFLLAIAPLPGLSLEAAHSLTQSFYLNYHPGEGTYDPRRLGGPLN